MSEPSPPVSTDERLMLIPVDPAPEFIESSGRWKWPLKPPHDNDGRCPHVYTASREWWEYVPDGAKPHPWAEATQLRDGKWYWTVPTPRFEAPAADDPIPQCDTTTARVRKLIEMDAVPNYLVRALLHERDSWRQNYWERMEQIAKAQGRSQPNTTSAASQVAGAKEVDRSTPTYTADNVDSKSVAAVDRSRACAMGGEHVGYYFCKKCGMDLTPDIPEQHGRYNDSPGAAR